MRTTIANYQTHDRDDDNDQKMTKTPHFPHNARVTG